MALCLQPSAGLHHGHHAHRFVSDCFRRTWGKWQESLADVVTFAKENDFACIDVGPVDVSEIKSIFDAGLKVGSVDAKNWGDLCSSDGAKRKAAVAENVEYMKAVAELGATNFFIVLLPEDHTAKRSENFGYAVESLGAVCDEVASSGARS